MVPSVVQYRSHPHKMLADHTQGVITGTENRTALRIGRIAAIFHDVGKLNLNFQGKLDNLRPVSGPAGYDHHAYLSAYAFLCFLAAGNNNAFDLKGFETYSILALIARHHGHLPNFMGDGGEGIRITSILKKDECVLLKNFLLTNPVLPASEFLQPFIKHQPFELLDVKSHRFLDKLGSCAVPSDALDYFLDTQFAFASLIESDKRDAADNKEFGRKAHVELFATTVNCKLTERLESFQVESALNQTRLRLREEAVKSINTALDSDRRVFSLTAPTGSGKTLVLLSLANEILKRDSSLAVLYALPFLSITEQVEGISRSILGDELVLRFDSKAQNQKIDDLQNDLDSDPELLDQLLQESFSQETFDAPFIITTFVQLFETLVSNRNSTLLRLPNFAKTIILVDELQALPPRLYVFFTAFLDAFCRKFDSYAVLSTATMPALDIAHKSTRVPEECPEKLFTSYVRPSELVETQSYYSDPVFDRYTIERINDPEFSLDLLAAKIKAVTESCLAILNTIDDTTHLFAFLNPEDGDAGCLLLNTHFTPLDRRKKIDMVKEKLDGGERVVLVTTQLIEAGVDIDFPVVFRDLCPLPNLIQAAGRCNRNGLLRDGEGKPKRGTLFLFELKNNGKSRAALIYGRDEPSWFLGFTRSDIPALIHERDLLAVQTAFFEQINRDLSVGDHRQLGKNMIRCINEIAFEDLGRFRLIDEKQFGTEYQYYIPASSEDDSLESLQETLVMMAEAERQRVGYKQMKALRIRLQSQLRHVSQHIVQIRFRNDAKDRPSSWPGPLGILKLGNEKDYTFVRGLSAAADSNFL